MFLHADSKYPSQFAVRATLDYEPLRTISQCFLKFFPGSWRFFSHANINYTADITSQAFIISYKYRFFSGKKGSGGLFLVSRWHYLVFLEVKKYDMKEFVTVMIEETLLLLFVK